MSSLKAPVWIGLALVLLDCSQAHKESIESGVVADTKAQAVISSSAAIENKKDTTRKFIRTAELKFKAKSVIKATYHIEEVTQKMGGFVTYTNLTSTIDHVTTTPVSADSSLESTYYSVVNTMTLRVPNVKLDTTLKEISKNIDYLDFRIIKAEDVALQLLSNQLTQSRSTQNEKRLTKAIEERGKKLKETTSAEELLLNKQEQADQAKISNLSLLDQIQFSTIHLTVYQRPSVKRELISNDKNIDGYEPGFGSKLLEALQYGWDILEAFLVFLAKLWGLFLFGALVYLAYRFSRGKF